MNKEYRYPIYDVSQVLDSGAEELMGTKPKEWGTYTVDGKLQRMLYKEGRPGTEVKVLQMNKDAPVQIRLFCELASPSLSKPWDEYENEFKLIFTD